MEVFFLNCNIRDYLFLSKVVNTRTLYCSTKPFLQKKFCNFIYFFVTLMLLVLIAKNKY